MLGVINLENWISHHDAFKKSKDVEVEKVRNAIFRKRKQNYDLYPTEIRIWIGTKEFFVLFNGRLDERENLCTLLSINPKNISDAYLVALLFEKYDLDFLRYLEGDFAFSIWDKEKNRLVLVRDPIGIKNMFYSFEDGHIIWSSRISDILMLTKKNKINDRFIKEFLLDHPIAKQDTAYKNIQRLENGQYLLYEKGKESKGYYYEFRIPKVSYQKEEDYYQHFYSLFVRSVQNRMRTSNHRISIPLSGGMDSSSIVSIAENINIKNNNKYDISTYSILFNEKEADERQYINAMIAKYNLKSTFLSGDNEWNFKCDFNIFKNFDEPYPLFNIALASKTLKATMQDNISVVLTGHGGDHILHADLNYLGEYLKKGKFIRYFKEFNSWRNSYPTYHLLKKNTIDPIFQKHTLSFPSWLNKKEFDDIELSHVLTKRFEELKWDDKTITAYFNTIIRQTGHEWFDQYLSNPLGIERRYPFLDRQIMEFMAAVPPNMKLKPSNNKYILRESLKQNLPAEIYNRKSKGSHGFLITKGFKEEWEKITEYYNFDVLTELGLVNGKEIRNYCEKWYMGYRYDLYNASSIMRALALEIWLSEKQDII